MATTSNSTLELFDVEAAVMQWTEAARKVTEDTLDLYLKTVDELATAEVKAAKATKVPALATIAEAHAGVSREIVGTYVSTVRDLIKA